MAYARIQGCQMVCFQTKIPNWVIFGGSCNGRCWYILGLVGLFYSHGKYFMAIWYILWPLFYIFGILYQEKSGNPSRIQCLIQLGKTGKIIRNANKNILAYVYILCCDPIFAKTSCTF
jgi:hypothetical protein